MICASEDVGMADPNALNVAVNASLAVERIGMPEARILLSQAAVYVATAPKSNASYVAIGAAQEEVRKSGNLPVPPHLQDSHYGGAKALNRGIGYQYAHDFPNHYVAQQYLPYELTGREFFRPGGNGYEITIKEHMKKLKENSIKK